MKGLPARNLGPEHPKTSGIFVMRNMKEFKQMFLLPSLRIINMDSTHPELLICQCSTRMEKDTTNYGRLTWRGFSTPCWRREFFLSSKSEIDNIQDLVVEAQIRLELDWTLKPKKSVCLLVSAYKLVYLQSSCVAGFLIRSITGCKERDPEKGQTYKPVRSAPILDTGPLYHLSCLALNQPLKSAQTWSDLWVPRNTARCRTKLTKYAAFGTSFIYAYLKPNIVLSCFFKFYDRTTGHCGQTETC